MVKKWKMVACFCGTLYFCLTCGCGAIAAALAGWGIFAGGQTPQ